jgi:hypothetical protein
MFAPRSIASLTNPIAQSCDNAFKLYFVLLSILVEMKVGERTSTIHPNSHDCAIGLVKLAIERGANITEVFVDTVGDPTSDLGQVLSQLHQFLASMALNEHNLVMVILE